MHQNRLYLVSGPVGRAACPSRGGRVPALRQPLGMGLPHRRARDEIHRLHQHPAQAVIDEIGHADDWGLSAAAFQLPPAGDLTDKTEEQADAEIKLALGVLKYARHARGGRANPSSVSRLFDQVPPLKDPKTVLVEIAAAGEPAAYLRALHPKHEQFQLLRQALKL